MKSQLPTQGSDIVTEASEISLLINVDDVSMFKSTSAQFQPMPGKPYVSQPFLIGILVWPQ